MAIDYKKRQKFLDSSILIIGTISAGLVYFICYVIDIPLIDNARWLTLLLFVKVISFTLMLVGVGILLYLGVNWHLRRSKSFENHIVIKNILISFLVIMIVMALIDEYRSNICTGREEHYLETVGYFRDLEMLPSMVFGLHEEDEYTGKLTLDKQQDSHSGWLGHSIKSKPVYYLVSEDHKVIGVLSIIDLDDIDIDSNEEYHVIYYPDVNIITSIEIVPFESKYPLEIWVEDKGNGEMVLNRPKFPTDYNVYEPNYNAPYWYTTKDGEFFSCRMATHQTDTVVFPICGEYTITLVDDYDKETGEYTSISNTVKFIIE